MDMPAVHNQETCAIIEPELGELTAVPPDGEMGRIASINKNCRRIKGRVFLWKDNQSRQDLWDADGTIKS